jgi:hypothetical protein
MFGIGETAAAITGIMSALRALNEGIATIKESGSNAASLGSLVSKYSEVEQRIQDVEKTKAGVLTVKQSLNLTLAKRQAATFNRQLKDALLMSGQGSVYQEVVARVEESKIAHEKAVAKLKRAKLRRAKEIREAGLYVGIGLIVTVVVLAIAVVLMKVYE